MYRTNNNIKINSIKNFTPWEDEPEQYIGQFYSTRQNPKKSRPNYLTIQTKQNELYKKQKERKMLRKTILNISKVNLNHSRQIRKDNYNYANNVAKRYDGPRVSFYSKMNPKGFQNTTIYKNSFHKADPSLLKFFPRDKSIKLLDILQQSPTPSSRQLFKNTNLQKIIKEIQFPRIDVSVNLLKERKDKGYANIRRLKNISEDRKSLN